MLVEIWAVKPAFSRKTSNFQKIWSVQVQCWRKIEASKVIVGQVESRIRVCIVANRFHEIFQCLRKKVQSFETTSKTTLVRSPFHGKLQKDYEKFEVPKGRSIHGKSSKSWSSRDAHISRKILSRGPERGRSSHGKFKDVV